MPAKIITCFNQKGGSGKTTTAAQLADTFGRRGYCTTVADIDSQSTASLLWGAQRAAERIETYVLPMAHFGNQFIEKLAGLADQSDLIFIDCPPELEDDLCWRSLVAADLILIPVPPSMGDVISSLQAGEFAAKARDENPTVKIAYLVSQNRRGMFHRKAIDALYSKAKEPVLSTEITQRAIFVEAQARNCGVQWVDPNSKSPATTELNSLADEIAALIKLPKPKTKNRGRN